MNKKLAPRPSLMNGVALAALMLLGTMAAADAAFAQSAPSLSRGNVTVNSDVLDALGPPPGATGSYTPPLTTSPSKTKSTKPKSQFLGPPTLGASAPSPAPAPVTTVASSTPTSSFTPPAASSGSRPPPSYTPSPIPSTAPMPAAAPTPAPAPAPSSSTASLGSSNLTGGASPTPTPSYAPPPAPKAAPKAAPQTASLPTSRTPVVPTAAAGSASLAFTADSADLSDDAKQSVGGVIQKLNALPDARVKLSAYASGTPETLSQTRRLSLSRALAVRSYLIDQGVKSTRIDVLALGNQVQSGSADRVDLLVVAQ